MDSRKDEQERGITMKSSSIALLHSKGKCNFKCCVIQNMKKISVYIKHEIL
jgi:translation elongation factor EF-G